MPIRPHHGLAVHLHNILKRGAGGEAVVCVLHIANKNGTTAK